jgi:hypothetical protein
VRPAQVRPDLAACAGSECCPIPFTALIAAGPNVHPATERLKPPLTAIATRNVDVANGIAKREDNAGEPFDAGRVARRSSKRTITRRGRHRRNRGGSAMTEPGDGTSGSELGGFGHADSIEPGVVDEATGEDPGNDLPELADPEGLAGAHDEAHDDESPSGSRPG